MLDLTPAVAEAATPVPSHRRLTMSDLIGMIERDPEPPPIRKRDLISAVRSFCRLLGLDPAATPAAHAYFRRHVQKFHHLNSGRSRKTFQNVRALVNTALQRYVTAEKQLVRETLAPDWQALQDSVRGSPDLMYGLSRLLRYCNEREIAPTAVTDAVAEDFLAWLRDETFVKRPEVVHRRCLVLWNQCTTTIAGWPKLKLAVPSNRATYCISWAQIPASLRKDIEAWLAHLAEADPMSLEGPAWPARPATITARRFQVRQLVSALDKQGQDISQLKSLHDVVQPSVAREALRFFYERSGKRTGSQIAGLAAVIFTIGKYWCRLNEKQLAELRLLKHNLAYRSKGLTNKNRERLRQFADRRNIEALIYLPQKIYEAVRRKNRNSIVDALDMQVAIAVELLLMMPVRRTNLVRLRFGPDGHIRPRQSRAGTTHVVIDRNDVKNNVDLEFPLPRASAELLDIYLGQFRPILAKTASYWVFPGEGPSGHKSLDQFSRQFSKTVRRWTGLDVNLHLMRHIGAKLYLDQNPGAYEVVRRVLGHTSLSTTVNSYTGMETEAAVKHFDAVILGIRDAVGRNVGHA